MHLEKTTDKRGGRRTRLKSTAVSLHGSRDLEFVRLMVCSDYEEATDRFSDDALPQFAPPGRHHEPPLDIDLMSVDETKDKIVIHDLAAEIAAIEAAESRPMFLPDIDKKVSAIPPILLQNAGDKANTQLVLYQVPSSISIPEEKDAVRKAIIAARARAQEKETHEMAPGNVAFVASEANLCNGDGPMDSYDEPDAMDIG